MSSKKNSSGISKSKTSSKPLYGKRSITKPSMKVGSNGKAGRATVVNGVLPNALKSARSTTKKARMLRK